MAVSQELLEVLAVARRLAEKTDGMYNPTIGPVVRLWCKARQTGNPLEPSVLVKEYWLVSYKSLLLDAEQQTALRSEY